MELVIKQVKVFGLGAIGSNLLIQLIKQFPDLGYIGVDFDKVEERNIGTQAYFLEQAYAKQPKAKAIHVIAQRYIRKVKYRAENTKVTTPISLPDPNVLFIDCFDNSASRALFPSGDYNILHLGFSPLYTAECIWNNKYKLSGDVDPNGPDICELNEAIGFIHFFVNAALLNISDFLINGRKSDFWITNKTRIWRNSILPLKEEA